MNKYLHNSPIIIRNATVDDAPGIAAVHVKAWQESYQGIIAQNVLDNLSTEHRLSSWVKALQDFPERYFVASINQKIIGFCAAGPSRYEFAPGEIYAIYVLNAYKGKSIGYKLFCAAKLYLQSKNLTPFLTMALAENHTARTFYERQGGQVCGTHVYKINDKNYPEICYRFQ